MGNVRECVNKVQRKAKSINNTDEMMRKQNGTFCGAFIFVLFVKRLEPEARDATDHGELRALWSLPLTQASSDTTTRQHLKIIKINAVLRAQQTIQRVPTHTPSTRKYTNNL